MPQIYFNDCVTNSGYVAWNDYVLVKNKLGRMWEKVFKEFKELFRHLRVLPVKERKKPTVFGDPVQT